MFESFVIMLREGIEAALVVAITLAVVKRTGRRELERAVYAGVGLAALASAAVAAVLRVLAMSSEAYEAALYWVAAVFVASMMVWMHRKGKTLRRDIERRVGSVDVSRRGSIREKLAIGGFVFFMVFREGVEAVLFLSAVSLTTSSLLSFAGSVLGVAVAVAFAVLFVRGSLKTDLKRFFTVTEWVLCVFVLQLVVNGYHELAEQGWMPANRMSMAWIGPIVKNNSLFIMAIVAIPLFIWMTGNKGRKAVPDDASPAEKRLAMAKSHRARSYRLSVVLTTLLVLGFIGAAYAKDLRPKTQPPPEPVVQRGGNVVIPVSDLADGKLHHFSYPIGGRVVVFIAMKLPGRIIRAALNACNICGPVGYIQQGSNLVCLNCDSTIDAKTLGQAGGCNPIPLPSRVAKGNLVIRVSDLAAKAWVFPKKETPVYHCAVCGMRLLPWQVGATVHYRGKAYRLCKMPDCLKLFKQDPQKYAH